MEIRKDHYNKYVKQVTPVYPLWRNMLRAFLTGGVICTLGQFLLTWLTAMGLDEKSAAAWQLLVLILTSVLLTGFNIYQKIVKWGRRRSTGADHRICQLRSGACYRI